MFLSYDITNFIDWFINLMFNGISSCFLILDNIVFHGVSLLDFSLALILIELGLTLFVNVVKITGRQGRADVASHLRKD